MRLRLVMWSRTRPSMTSLLWWLSCLPVSYSTLSTQEQCEQRSFCFEKELVEGSSLRLEKLGSWLTGNNQFWLRSWLRGGYNQFRSGLLSPPCDSSLSYLAQGTPPWYMEANKHVWKKAHIGESTNFPQHRLGDVVTTVKRATNRSSGPSSAHLSHVYLGPLLPSLGLNAMVNLFSRRENWIKEDNCTSIKDRHVLMKKLVIQLNWFAFWHLYTKQNGVGGNSIRMHTNMAIV